MKKAKVYILENSGDVEIKIERDGKLQPYSAYPIKPLINSDAIGTSIRLLDTLQDLLSKGFEFGGITMSDKD